MYDTALGCTGGTMPTMVRPTGEALDELSTSDSGNSVVLNAGSGNELATIYVL